MKQFNTIGVDLAKNVIQVSVVTPGNREVSNKELTRIKFAEFLAKQKPGMVAFEACATAHHWARLATTYGHQVKIIPAIAVAPFRQGHKTDKNDALAVAEAANRPNIKVAPMKSIDHQSVQSIQRSRELIIQERTATSNHIRGLLLEFGVVIPKGLAYLRRLVPLILEDAENGLPMSYRPTLHRMFMRFQAAEEDLAFMDEQIKHVVKSNDGCQRLTALEGVGPIGAILLFATLGSGDAFKNGREFSAYIGLTPKQYSSGGKTNVIGISRHVANRRLRAVLIQGARAYVRQWVISVPFPLRFLFASQPKIMGKALSIVYRTIATHLTHKAGYTKATAHPGAVTLIQRFGSALNLNIHFHMLFLDGVYGEADSTAQFRWVKAPTNSDLRKASVPDETGQGSL